MLTLLIICSSRIEDDGIILWFWRKAPCFQLRVLSSTMKHVTYTLNSCIRWRTCVAAQTDEAGQSDLTATVIYLLKTRVCISHHVLIWSLFIFLSSEEQQLLRQLQKHRCRCSEQLLHTHQLPFVLDLSWGLSIWRPEIQMLCLFFF